MMRAWIVATVTTGAGFLALDATWLSLAASRLYRPKLGPLLLDRFQMLPAAAFYFVYLAGIMIFAVAPGVAAGRGSVALARGALLGLVAYSTYDLTNQATLKGWSMAVTVADLCWGMVVTAAAATIGFTVARWMLARG